MYKHILCPVDGSPASRLGLQHAIGLAKALDARIRLIHVVDELSVIPPAEVYPAGEITDLIAVLKEGGEKLLEETLALASKQGTRAEKALIESFGGPVSRIIVDDAKKWGADLIAMGTHGRRGLNRLLLGSDAERVLREAPVPVLLVRHPEEKEK